MRVRGIMKIILTILADFMLVYCVLGIEAALLTTSAIMLYAWIGEYIALLKDRAISLNNMNDYEKLKLMRARECLVEDVNRLSGNDISRLKMHVIPSDSINAYAYGFNNVAITRAALNVCDDTTLCSVLSHEVSHILNMDAVFHRMIFANVTLVIAGLTVGSVISVSFMWIVFLILCAFGICGGWISMFAFHGVQKVVKAIFNVFQNIVLFVYQIVMGAISRGSEFRADKYSCQLGYGPQLSYFLTRFVDGQESRQKSLSEILYASHPATYKRVLRIEQHNSNT